MQFVENDDGTIEKTTVLDANEYACANDAKIVVRKKRKKKKLSKSNAYTAPYQPIPNDSEMRGRR